MGEEGFGVQGGGVVGGRKHVKRSKRLEREDGGGRD